MTFDEFLEEWRSDSPVISVMTSGSTGVPKRTVLKKEFARMSAVRTNSFFGINPSSRLHSCVAADYIGGKMMAVRSELAGCRLTWEIPSNRPLSGLGSEERIDLLAVVPSQMLHIVERSENTGLPDTGISSGFPALGAIIIGGAAIHPDLRNKIIRSGLNAYETYGMTETASHIALRRVAEGEDWFHPLPGITISLDFRNCLIINFDSGEQISTNDIAILNHEGGFRILGRYDNVIVTGGKKVNPEDVEARIAPLIKGDFIITSCPDEKWGEKIVLLIEGEPEDVASLMESMRGLLRSYEMPKEIEWVANLPRTSNGKLKR